MTPDSNLSHPTAPAPGGPGSPPTWAPAAKSGVGTALGAASPVWFSLAGGVLTEVYFPFVDTACTRDLGLLVVGGVAGGEGFYSDERTDARPKVEYVAPGVPAYHVTNTCKRGRYRIEKAVLADPRRAAVLQRVHFRPLVGDLADYRLFVLLHPHLGNQGWGNTAWVGDFKGVPMLFARRDGNALALACSAPWRARSAGYAGASDGRDDVARNGKLTQTWARAENGNVVLMGEVDLSAPDSMPNDLIAGAPVGPGGPFVLALAFGRDESEAGHRARASLMQGFDAARRTYVRGWAEWQKALLPLGEPASVGAAAGAGSAPGEGAGHGRDLYHVSAAVMRVHESKAFPGAIIAGLAVPWGESPRGDKDMGYHLVWTRDMVQTVGGLLAIRQHEDARRVLFYLSMTQEADGHWPQNMFLDGRASWTGTQLDETAFPILLVDLARRETALGRQGLSFLWPMVRKAAGFLVRNGPVTPMDRWEEMAGYYVSTMAVEIAALLAAADLAEAHHEPEIATYLRETADAWNDAVESLLYVTGTDLAKRAGVEGYYVRYARPDQLAAPSPAAGEVQLPNHPQGEGPWRVADMVSPDSLCLVRFGLRGADDPRIVNTVRVIDQELKVETPAGPCWHRYTADGYGEHADGSPYNGTGIGRVWPLLTGERAHYELAAGRADEARQLLHTLEGFANDSGLLPEQVWDTHDLPDKDLYRGRATGSAMPLVWAHAEYAKLRRSLHDGRVFDTPPQPVRRYQEEKRVSPHAAWRFDQPRRWLPIGKTLRVEVMSPAMARWSSDNWQTPHEVHTRDTGLGVHVADLETQDLPAGTEVIFTFHWPAADRWEGRDFQVTVEAGDGRNVPAAATGSAGTAASQ